MITGWRYALKPFLPVVVAASAVAVLIAMAAMTPLYAAAPRGFVYLRDIDPTILQDIRNAGWYNPLGRKLRGFEARECILTVKAARALKAAQDILSARKISLKVYECYRPARAQRDIAAWAQTKDSGDAGASMKAAFYPTLSKAELIELGYLDGAAHIRGNTVAVAMVPLPLLPTRLPRRAGPRRGCHLSYARRARDNALDFGTGYGCLHPKARPGHPGVAANAAQNRAELARVMRQAGFIRDPRRWWRFTLRGEPRNARAYDFAIREKSAPLDDERLIGPPPPDAAPSLAQPRRLHPPRPVRGPRAIISPAAPSLPRGAEPLGPVKPPMRPGVPKPRARPAPGN